MRACKKSTDCSTIRGQHSIGICLHAFKRILYRSSIADTMFLLRPTIPVTPARHK